MLKGPFIRSKNSIPKVMRNVVIALLPIIIFSFYKNGLLPYIHGKATFYGMIFPLLFIFIGTISSFIFEAIYTFFILKKRGQALKDTLKRSYAFFPGLFLSLILPINTPILLLILGCFCATIIGKMLYGGFGHNIFNPALVGCLIILAMYSSSISQMGGYLNVEELDAVTSATPLTNVQLQEGIGTYDTLVKPYGSLWNFFVGTIPGAVGETSALLCLVAFVYLSSKHAIKWRIPLTYVVTVFLITWIIGDANHLGIWYPLFQVLSGGLLFGAVFMTTDPVTSPVTVEGQVLEGMALGILTVVFRFLTPLPEGVLTSILTLNLLVPILDKIGSHGKTTFSKLCLPFLILSALAVGCGWKIGHQFLKEKADSNFEILDVVTNGDQYIYTVTQKGNGGPIKSKVTVKNKQIVSFEVIDQKETQAYYQIVLDQKYIEQIIQKQNQLNDLDAVSGATISSTALKKTAINVLKDVEVRK